MSLQAGDKITYLPDVVSVTSHVRRRKCDGVVIATDLAYFSDHHLITVVYSMCRFIDRQSTAVIFQLTATESGTTQK